MRSEIRPQAVISVDRETGFARICAWCPDKAEADVWAEAEGLKASHGICLPCQPKLASDVTFEAGERCAAPSLAARGTATGVPSRLVFSCRRASR